MPLAIALSNLLPYREGAPSVLHRDDDGVRYMCRIPASKDTAGGSAVTYAVLWKMTKQIRVHLYSNHGAILSY
jgi:hypothetical protein